jgi:hypothetical protein
MATGARPGTKRVASGTLDWRPVTAWAPGRLRSRGVDVWNRCSSGRLEAPDRRAGPLQRDSQLHQHLGRETFGLAEQADQEVFDAQSPVRILAQISGTRVIPRSSSAVSTQPSASSRLSGGEPARERSRRASLRTMRFIHSRARSGSRSSFTWRQIRSSAGRRSSPGRPRRGRRRNAAALHRPARRAAGRGATVARARHQLSQRLPIALLRPQCQLVVAGFIPHHHAGPVKRGKRLRDDPALDRVAGVGYNSLVLIERSITWKRDTIVSLPGCSGPGGGRDRRCNAPRGQASRSSSCSW